MTPDERRSWTPDESLDYLVVASCGRGVPTAVVVSECGRTIAAELARLRVIENVARVAGFGICSACSDNKHSRCSGNCFCYCQA